MKAVDCDCARRHETLADDALGRHISELATVWHTEGRVRLGDGRATLGRLRAQRERMARLAAAGEHALGWAAQNISQVMAALEDCTYPARLPGVGRTARVRLLAREICAHSELKLGARRLLEALETFESVEPMEVEELWALHAALRLELGGAFADVCARVIRDEEDRGRAGEWAERLSEGADVNALGDRAFSDAFYERLMRLLSRRELPGALDALRRHAREHGVEPEEAARRAQAAEAMNAILLKNAVETLHTLERLDWRELSCALGSVHIWLMRDPAGVYPRMDFDSRQLYIRAVARIARRAGISQDAVARACVVAASEAQGPARHVGWHLMEGEGQERFMEALGADTPALRARFRLRAGAKHIYIAAVAALALAWIAALCALGMPVWLGVTGIAPALTLAQQLVDRVCARIAGPRVLPRLALDEGVPDELRTLVTIPALLTSAERARELARQLETLAALEDDANVDFLLLGDFADSPRAAEAEDEAIAAAARGAIESANARAGRTRFFCLLRRREYNETHSRYMAHERKRGALMALNRLLLTGESEFEGETPAQLGRGYAFVITLDADTRVPPGALRRMIGTLGHPLNRAGEGQGGGWAVLQPRMELSLAAVTSPFVRALAGAGGFDAYQFAVSEACWDLTGEGSYAGKGIYDLRAFDARLRGALPDNAILSHDLLEGMLAGAGYMSDAPLYDGFPQTLESYLKRLHRWTRGDWQLMRYLGRVTPAPGGGTMRNRLSAFDRFRIFANLFRSLSAPVGLIVLLISLYAGSAWGLLLALAPLAAPVLMGRWSGRAFAGLVYRLSIWPAEAACVLDAVARTLYRVYASGRNMLEWVTSADADAQRSGRPMYANYAAAALCLPGLAGAWSWIPALMLGALFAAAPLWTRRMERRWQRPGLSHADARYLRELARDTWGFFEKHVSECGLPPDNVQVEPPLGASMRTSPTNTGLYMASCVAALRLGFIDERELLTRLARTLRSLERMDKWRGHPYNWVDIQTLAPLRPLYVSTVDSGNLLGCLYLCAAEADRLAAGGGETALRAAELAARLRAFIAGMDFAVLYDGVRELFHIGINTEQGALSRAYYDLLGSEARLASFAAMMKGDAPPRHFGRLGRACVKAGRGAALVSWSGTMFEYFMPHLLMDAPRGSLLERTLAGVLEEQMRRDPDMPWGVSESGYYGFDAQLNYPYRAFGLPQLALSGGDAGVIAPYAAEMAAAFAPAQVTANLRRMQEMGFRGEEGFFEAVDCEPGRLPEGARYRIVKSYMAHHKGMALMGLTNALEDDAMVRLFMDIPEARALRLLLEERAPGRVVRLPKQPPRSRPARPGGWTRRPGAQLCPPDALLMSGESASAFVTGDGRGYLRSGDMMINRWRGDVFGPAYGIRTYVCIGGRMLDMAQGRPRFEPGAARWERREREGNLALDMCLSPEDGALLCMASIENATAQTLEVEVTGCFEVALSAQADDEAHPGFRNLFVQSESPAPGALIFRRRRRSERDPEPMTLSAMVAPEDALLSCDSSRPAFMGRGPREEPQGLRRPLSGTVGRVLDPCSALRARFAVPAHSRRCALMVVRALESRAEAGDVLEKYADASAFERAHELSRLRARAQLEYLGVPPAEFFACMRMASLMAFADAPRRAQAQTGQDRRGLWQLGISGDEPIVLLRLDAREGVDAARQTMRLCQTLRALGMRCELAVACRGEGDYRQDTKDALRALGQMYGGAHILDEDALAPGQLELLRGAAALTLEGGSAPTEQIDALAAARERPPRSVGPAPPRAVTPYEPPREELHMSNGWGGFDGEGAYVIYADEHPTPAPWVNILANEDFGAMVSETGLGAVWHGSSREGRLTRWRGDALDEGCEQALYLRDELTGQFASLTPAPCGALPVRVRHAPGETRFEGRALDIDYELRLMCDAALPVMYLRARLINAGAGARQLTLTALVDWVMGERTSRLTRAFAQDGCALCAGEMPGVGFAAFVRERAEVCVNMLEFMGTEGTHAVPEAMLRPRLNAEEEMPQSPCGALRIGLELAPGAEAERTLVIGWAESAGAARERMAELRAWGPERRMALAGEKLRERLGRLRFELPDRALCYMVNDWLPYQTQAARLWARAGFYQPGGAFGFRDQLQDMLPLIDTDAPQVRGHILRCAAHQFRAGDVQHWWHEPYRGVRTRITDDMLFLPYVTALYICHTGDEGILEEVIPYLEDVEIPDGAEDIYTECRPSAETDTLRGHCLRAIERADTRGAHGLPLMGAGDWNDGMNRVGAQGKGESVWLGMFMCEVLREFAPYSGRADALLARRSELIAALEQHGWDGRWYRRAYYDDGRPLGSAQGEECRIDLLSQAWAALAGLDERRVSSALEAAWELLVDTDAGIVRLLTPPFDDGAEQPGYIKGYLPGIRENGGQYTHAAVWLMLALMRTGQRRRAWQVLEMLLPPGHADSRAAAGRYRVEPYVLAADIYGAPPYEGRGGWTWYTGSAAWLTYAVREHMLGLTVRAGRLRFAPRVPEYWQEVRVSYAWGSARYEITARRSCRSATPPEAVRGGWIELKDDGAVHEITLPLR